MNKRSLIYRLTLVAALLAAIAGQVQQSLSPLKETPLVFVCKTDKRSAKAAQLLRDAAALLRVWRSGSRAAARQNGHCKGAFL